MSHITCRKLFRHHQYPIKLENIFADFTPVNANGVIADAKNQIYIRTGAYNGFLSETFFIVNGRHMYSSGTITPHLTHNTTKYGHILINKSYLLNPITEETITITPNTFMDENTIIRIGIKYVERITFNQEYSCITQMAAYADAREILYCIKLPNNYLMIVCKDVS